MNKEKIAHKLFLACEILQGQKFALQRDNEYPLTTDFVELVQAKSLINEVELLLKYDESKQPQPPDCANTMLGEVPHGMNDQPGENLKAVEGATPVVRQNEQTKEVCDFHGCFTYCGIDGIIFCAHCGEPM